MNSYPIENSQDEESDISAVNNSDGRTKIDNLFSHNQQQYSTNLKYPIKIDPFRVIPQIIFNSFLIFFLLLLFAINFPLTCVVPLHYIELLLSGTVMLQCCLLLAFYLTATNWCNSLADAGFFVVPRRLRFRIAIILFVWCLSMLLLTPVLLLIKVGCDRKNHSFPNVCSGSLGRDHLMQIYLGIETAAILTVLLVFLYDIAKFRHQRHWPDVWHERLLEESAMIDWCPLVQRCELRIDSERGAAPLVPGSSPLLLPGLDDRGDVSIVSVSRSGELGTARTRDVMHAQAYLIVYLRRLNANLARKIHSLHGELKSALHLHHQPEQNHRHVSAPLQVPLSNGGGHDNSNLDCSSSSLSSENTNNVRVRVT